ncbi:hypothetical protein CHS0354_041613 [Potamilus streckersoni]|uniref:Uncharacterized protein n=1 Tax=Potamilus streckersoni TaxID=2493646 RepID=A0AAE0VUW3_9BIVA|nr:hypothetical protein CHS0354_041613 [Potamilus streckersoni]
MGNVGSKTTINKDVGNSKKPRVVLVSSSKSAGQWQKAATKVKFANMKSGHDTYTKRPQMVDIGNIRSDIFRGSKGRFTSSVTQMAGIGASRPVPEMTSSQLSVVTAASSFYSNGFVNPHEHTDEKCQPENENFDLKTRALAKVDEF